MKKEEKTCKLHVKRVLRVSMAVMRHTISFRFQHSTPFSYPTPKNWGRDKCTVWRLIRWWIAQISWCPELQIGEMVCKLSRSSRSVGWEVVVCIQELSHRATSWASRFHLCVLSKKMLSFEHWPSSKRSFSHKISEIYRHKWTGLNWFSSVLELNHIWWKSSLRFQFQNQTKLPRTRTKPVWTGYIQNHRQH